MTTRRDAPTPKSPRAQAPEPVRLRVQTEPSGAGAPPAAGGLPAAGALSIVRARLVELERAIGDVRRRRAHRVARERA